MYFPNSEEKFCDIMNKLKNIRHSSSLPPSVDILVRHLYLSALSDLRGVPGTLQLI